MHSGFAEELEASQEKYRTLDDLAGVIKDGGAIPALDELVEALIAQWGGPDRFVESMHEVFINAKPGSLIQAKIMTEVWKLVQMRAQVTSQMQATYDHLTETQAEALLSQTLKEVTAYHAPTGPAD